MKKAVRNKNEWFKLFHRDWLESERVARLSAAAQGIYFRCLCLQAVYQTIPANISELCRHIKLSKQVVTKEWKSLVPFFEEEEIGGEKRLYNERLRQVLSDSLRERKAKAKGAQSANAKRYSKLSDTAQILSGKRALRASISNSNSSSKSKQVTVTTGEVVPAPPSEPAAKRKPDLLFEAIGTVCGLDWTSPANAKQIGKCKAKLLAYKPPITADEVLLYGEVHKALHPVNQIPTWTELANKIGIVRQRDRVQQILKNPGIGKKPTMAKQPGFLEHDPNTRLLTPEEQEQARLENEGIDF